MRKRTRIIIAFLIIITGCFGSIYFYLTLPSKTPELAIRKYVFLDGNPFEAFELSIGATNDYDLKYGRLFEVKGYYANEFDLVEIPFFYLRKDEKGWFVTEAGTGP